jgi:hypothetical protein
MISYERTTVGNTEADTALESPEKPLFVLMTPELKSGKLLTLPGGRLLHGEREQISVERNAFQIVRRTRLDFVPTAGAWISDHENGQHGEAYLVEPAWHSKPAAYRDHTNLSDTELIPATPQPHASLELHSHTALLARIQRINQRIKDFNEHKADEDKVPTRIAEEAFVRAYGRFILQQGRY